MALKALVALLGTSEAISLRVKKQPDGKIMAVLIPELKKDSKPVTDPALVKIRGGLEQALTIVGTPEDFVAELEGQLTDFAERRTRILSAYESSVASLAEIEAFAKEEAKRKSDEAKKKGKAAPAGAKKPATEKTAEAPAAPPTPVTAEPAAAEAAVVTKGSGAAEADAPAAKTGSLDLFSGE